MLDLQNPQIWWFIARASGIIAWALMTLTVVWGILLKTRILRGADNPDWLQNTHRYISGLSLSMIVVHLFALWRDEFIEFGLRELFVPFASAWNPVGVALGVFSLYLVVAIQATALLSKHLPDWLWKGVHLTSYVAIILVALHSGLVGSDVGAPWYTVISLILITTATLAGIVRVVIAGRATPRPAGPAAKTSPRAPSSGPVVSSSAAPAKTETFPARVTQKRIVGDYGSVLTVEPIGPNSLEPWDAGSHLTLHLPTGDERQYSLAGDPADQNSLILGVANSGLPDGASGWINANVREGDILRCSGPLNHFPLRPSRRYQFIAAGIGITPIRAMLHSIPRGREFSVIYIGSSREEMLFLDDIVELSGDHLTVWVTQERGARPDLRQLVDPAADIYACGPQGFLDELETIVDPQRLHVERFSPKDRKSQSSHPSFTVIAARSGVSAVVAEDESIVDALGREGVELRASCKRGVCGTCEAAVVNGVPEHLDSVMDDADKDEMGIMFPCVSRSKSESLTIMV